MPGLERVAIIVLAAGTSTRLGRPKQLVRLGGRVLLQHVVDAAAAAQPQRIVLVLGSHADEVRAALRLPAPVQVVVNDEPSAGQATSLALGIGALVDLPIDRAVILLGDQPQVDPAVIAAVATGPGPIRRARYADGVGHPVAFDRALWSQLTAIVGDRGARELIAAHPEDVHEVPVAGTIPRDVDTEDDVRAIGADG